MHNQHSKAPKPEVSPLLKSLGREHLKTLSQYYEERVAKLLVQLEKGDKESFEGTIGSIKEVRNVLKVIKHLVE